MVKGRLYSERLSAVRHGENPYFTTPSRHTYGAFFATAMTECGTVSGDFANNIGMGQRHPLVAVTKRLRCSGPNCTHLNHRALTKLAGTGFDAFRFK